MIDTNMRRLLALALWLCLGVSPALAGFTQVSGTGTGGAVFNSTFFAGTSCSGSCPTTTVGLNAGDILVVYMQQSGAGTPTFGCSDGVGNTWQAAPGHGYETGTGAATEIWYSKLTNPITNGSTVTCTDTLGAGFLMTAVAFRPAGTAAFDTNATGVGGAAATSATVGPSPTLACPSGAASCEVCVAGSSWHSAGTTGSDATWTTSGGTGAGNPWTTAFKIVSATTALSYTATDTTSSVNGLALACFKDTPAAGGSYGGGTTVGVGH